MTTSELRAVQVGAGEGRPLRVLGEVVTRKVASEQTGGAYALFETIVRPGDRVPPHIHHREDECFYLLEGTFDFTIQGSGRQAAAGSLIYVAKGTLVAYENVGKSSGRLLVWQTPGGLSERFYEEVGEEVGAGPGSAATEEHKGSSLAYSSIAKIAARYGIEIIVPRDQDR